MRTPKQSETHNPRTTTKRNTTLNKHSTPTTINQSAINENNEHNSRQYTLHINNKQYTLDNPQYTLRNKQHKKNKTTYTQATHTKQ